MMPSANDAWLVAALALLLTLLLAAIWLLRKIAQHLTHNATRAGTQLHPLSVPGRMKLVDTSAWIDGRLNAIAAAHFLEGTLAVPKSVLTELQRIADSEDPEKRRRGRRGLEHVEQATSSHTPPTHVLDDDQEHGSVDARLVRLCVKHNAALITTDFNLQRVAEAQGVQVLNVHALAHALKRALQAGDRVKVTLVRPGREPGQGLGYLEDGTILVVEEGNQRIGDTLDVVVVRSRQTAMGQMAFARIAVAPATESSHASSGPATPPLDLGSNPT